MEPLPRPEAAGFRPRTVRSIDFDASRADATDEPPRPLSCLAKQSKYGEGVGFAAPTRELRAKSVTFTNVMVQEYPRLLERSNGSVTLTLDWMDPKDLPLLRHMQSYEDEKANAGRAHGLQRLTMEQKLELAHGGKHLLKEAMSGSESEGDSSPKMLGQIGRSQTMRPPPPPMLGQVGRAQSCTSLKPDSGEQKAPDTSNWHQFGRLRVGRRGSLVASPPVGVGQRAARTGSAGEAAQEDPEPGPGLLERNATSRSALRVEEPAAGDGERHRAARRRWNQALYTAKGLMTQALSSTWSPPAQTSSPRGRGFGAGLGAGEENGKEEAAASEERGRPPEDTPFPLRRSETSSVRLSSASAATVSTASSGRSSRSLSASTAEFDPADAWSGTGSTQNLMKGSGSSRSSMGGSSRSSMAQSSRNLMAGM